MPTLVPAPCTQPKRRQRTPHGTSPKLRYDRFEATQVLEGDAVDVPSR